MTPQPRITLFTIPLELRHEIYSYLVPCHGIHISIENARPRISACVQPRPNDPRCGHERRYLRNTCSRTTPDPVFARRAASTWGAHWKCEELAKMEKECNKKMRLVWTQVSHQMLTDVLAYVIEISTTYVTDLETLKKIITPNAPLVPEYLSSVLAHIRHLSVTLRLPLDTFRQIEASYTRLQTPRKSKTPIRKQKAPHHHRKSRPEWRRAAHPPIWPTICSGLANLKNLQKLDVWIDHNSKSSWSVVHERAFLAQLESLLGDEVNVTAHIPKLHPKYEDDERHYTDTSAVPDFRIERRRREICIVEIEDGKMKMEIKMDFPIYLYDSEYDETQDDDDDNDTGGNFFNAEFQKRYKQREGRAEAYERTLWEQGADVDDLNEIDWSSYYWRPAPKVPDRGWPDRSMMYRDDSDESDGYRRSLPFTDPPSDESDEEDFGHGNYSGRGMYSAQGLRGMGKTKRRARR
ncbi:hypothetical protein FB567DRAFT_255062 [Paraphoma chrysanthemicola]|uniref:Uncharacterized protein n=1 Tax=Paraphoma chrysanthemicola TaxID=798071 RepID=A0A8K0QT77_9PLEO|nr:hypothetical protein FB567DRAFT_255062 [Paraphoma chrysanthemicola]